MVLGLSVAELVMAVSAVALVLAAVVPAVGRVAMIVAVVAFITSSGAFLFTGPRWQMLPVLLVGLIALILTVRRLGGRNPEPRRRPPHHTVAAAVALIVIGLGGVAAWALPRPEFPAPTGPHSVGTTVLQWTDEQRPEEATADAEDRRTVVVQVWYPAVAQLGATRARYLGRTEHEAHSVSEAEARYLGVPGLALSHLVDARSAAVPDAPVLHLPERFPVVLFSPGLGGVRTQNTVWATELASRGYAVAALDHPYDSAAVTLADGTTIGTRVAATGNDNDDRRRAERWAAIRASDLSFVLTQLGEEAGSPLTRRLDTSRAAATGHSLGGAAALLAARQDQRFRAVIDIDGFPRDPAPGAFRQPALAITHELQDGEGTEYLQRLDEALQHSATAGYRLTVPGSAHLTFTDAPLFLPPLRTLIGAHGRHSGARITADVTGDFLDATLRGHAHDVPARLAEHGDLTVVRAAR